METQARDMGAEMKIGTRVVDKYGMKGTVVKLYDDFSAISASCLSCTGERWLAGQAIPFEDFELIQVWASVDLDAGGRIWSPVSRLTKAGGN